MNEPANSDFSGRFDHCQTEVDQYYFEMKETLQES